ncbi:hypothetical protein M231_07709 [Tremella mesenterica]|uniref:Uncharacterized protein n=1 Tax=Tremella mesenterica TaxID=5217 RepID=A0A4Q1BFF8_TREME|nr:hypothetical protein M231_07709 [Tremella mesenterica]
MKPFRARKRFFFLILAACLTLLWRFSIRPHLITPSIEQDQSTLPLITLIVVFKGVNLPPTLPYFFDSLRYQNRVELVFVQRDGCSDLKKLGAPSNLKHVCLSEKAFWLTHVDYFCRHWGGCTHHRRKTMLEDMRYLGSMPMPQAVYPILRGWVFQKYISPSTVWWGFCDVDIFLGDFARTFPYDLSEEYEILIPTDQLGPGPQLIFMRGHMTFLKNSKEVEGKMMEYGYFKSYEKWNDMGKPDSCNEESEYSHFVLSHPTLNVLSFEAMARHQPVKLFSPSGVYTLPPSYRPSHGIPPTLPRELLVSMFTPSTTSPFIDLDGSSSSFQSEDSFSSLESDISDSTSLSDTSQDIGREFPRSTKKGINGLHQFTSLGVERKVDLIQSTKPPNRGIWFTEKNVNWYTSSSDKGRWRRYFIKRGLEYSERLEPIQIIYKHGGRGMEGMEEWLYVHWQEDKRKVGSFFSSYTSNSFLAFCLLLATFLVSEL